MTQRDAGVTLLEVMIALFVIAMLSTAGVAILSSTLGFKEQFDAAETRLRQLEIARSVIKTDLAQLVLRPTRDETGARREFLLALGSDIPGAPMLAFTRAGWENPDGREARGSLAYVEYVRREDELLRRSSVRVDAHERTPEVERVLLSGLSAVDVSSSLEGRWYSAFAVEAGENAETAIPEMIELTLELEEIGPVRLLFLTGVTP